MRRAGGGGDGGGCALRSLSDRSGGRVEGPASYPVLASPEPDGW